jgi:UDP-GlcNAc:undecaprenyl-phosphate/decaprenyl-phosphate GlcNAc-1-phosphate transferase
MIQFFIAFISSLLITPLIIKIYKKNKWLDNPEKSKHAKKTHTKAVPRGGGLVVFFGIIIATLIFLPFLSGTNFDYQLIAILTGGLLLTIVGTLDDIFDIHPGLRLITGLIAALIVVGSGIGIAYISNPFGPGVIHLNQPQLTFDIFGVTKSIWVLADIFAVIFILWNMNIVNWSKGVDGQMPGFVSIALIFIGILSTRFIDDPTQFNTAYLAFIVSGAFAGLLAWNWYPQKIMPGYGAGSLAGYFLAILAILAGAKVATVLMVLGLPTADAIFTIMRRIIAGKSPLWGDRGHMHHKLLDVLKWGRRRIAVFYWLSSLLLGFLSLYLNTTGKLITMAIVFILVFGFLIWAKITTLKLQ